MLKILDVANLRLLTCCLFVILGRMCIADPALALQNKPTTAAARASAEEQKPAIMLASGTAYQSVPAAAQSRSNPYRTRTDIAAGRRLYEDNCQACHGRDALGSATAPSLRIGKTPREPVGAIFWFITRGDLTRKMPPWGEVLSIRERWQIVTYLKSGVPGAAVRPASSRSR